MSGSILSGAHVPQKYTIDHDAGTNPGTAIPTLVITSWSRMNLTLENGDG
jgi:hypothetical protein